MAFITSDKIKHKKSGEKIADASDIDFTGFTLPSDNMDSYTKAETDDLMDWEEV